MKTNNDEIIMLLTAAEHHYRPLDTRFADGLKHAAEIAQEGGRKHIAPAWMDRIAQSPNAELSDSHPKNPMSDELKMTFEQPAGGVAVRSSGTPLPPETPF